MNGELAMYWKIVAVAVGGAFGAMCRMGLSGFIDRRIPENFPWDTMLVNVIGCVLYGFIWYEIDKRVGVPAELKPFLITGFLGAFTTFSTFAFNSVMLMEKGQYVFAVANIVAHDVFGLLAIFAGRAISRGLSPAL
jgi:CrcB protein